MMIIDKFNQHNIAKIKSKLLAGATIEIDQKCYTQEDSDLTNWNTFIDTENHHANEWIFFRLNDKSRVRLTIKNGGIFRLIPGDKPNYHIIETSNKTIIAKNIEIEPILIHAPKQLFLGLYEYCQEGCLFCPLSMGNDKKHYSIDDQFKDIKNNLHNQIESIGITTAIPPNLTKEDVGDELAFVIAKIRGLIGNDIPIGVSTKTPSVQTLRQLKESGANEIRLNLEVFNADLAKILMPKKEISTILTSIADACQIFGKGKVSSNLIIGLGESDQDLLNGVEELAKVGAIATLYPYDPLPSGTPGKLLNITSFSTPTEYRLLNLAINHKKILDRYGLDTSTLKTMCPACSASHIFPGRDL